MKNRFSFTLILVLIIVNYSCIDRQFVDGRSELVSITDTTLSDSSIVIGYVHQIDGMKPYPSGYYDVWIENTSYKTTVDTNGFYCLKLIPGRYTIKCKACAERWNRLVEEIKDVEIMKNKKTRIDFYIGYTVE